MEVRNTGRPEEIIVVNIVMFVVTIKITNEKLKINMSAVKNNQRKKSLQPGGYQMDYDKITTCFVNQLSIFQNN